MKNLRPIPDIQKLQPIIKAAWAFDWALVPLTKTQPSTSQRLAGDMPHKTNITVKNGLTIQSRNNFKTTSKNTKIE